MKSLFYNYKTSWGKILYNFNITYTFIFVNTKNIFIDILFLKI